MPDAAVLRQGLAAMPARLARGLTGTLERRRVGLSETMARMEQRIERRVRPARQRLDRALTHLERATRALVDRRRKALEAAGGRLDALSPLATLRRGYSVARSDDGRVLNAVEHLPVGVRFHLRVSDGTVAAESLGPLPEERA